MDAIYDEAEIKFSYLVDSLRNDTHDMTRHDVGIPTHTYCYISNTNETEQTIELWKESNLMTYLHVWHRFMFAKMKSLNVLFKVDHRPYFINALTGKVLRCERAYDSERKYFLSGLVIYDFF